MIQKKSGAIELLIVLAVSAVLVFTMVFGFGTFYSGWHLVDDHMTFGFYDKLKNQGYSLWKLIREMFIYDYVDQYRDRFLFHPHRIIQTYFFGLDPKPYFIVKAVESVFAITAMYYAGKELNLNRAGAAAFSLTYFCGPQCAVWWKHGTPQIEASLFFALGFWMMLRYLKSGSRKHSFLSVLFFLLMSNHHESFIVMLPFIILFAVYYDWRKMGDKVQINLEVLWKAIRKRLAFEICLAVIFLFHMVYIIFFLGVNNYGSVDTHYPISDALNNYVLSLRGDLKYYWYFGVVLLFILVSFYEDFVKYLWAELLMLAAIIVPQLALYSKEGLFERYLLPITFAWSILFVGKAYGDGILKEKKRRIAYTVLLWAMIAVSIRKVAIEADYFRFRGQGVTAMLDEVVELQSKGYNVVSTLGTANPEADMTTHKLLAAYNLPDCMYWNTEGVLDHPLHYDWNSEHVDYLDFDVQDADFLIEYNRDDRHFTFDQDNIDHSKFNYVRCGTLDLYFSDRLYETFSDEDLERFKIKPTIYGLGE